jgi:hypothetical protein
MDTLPADVLDLVFADLYDIPNERRRYDYEVCKGQFLLPLSESEDEVEEEDGSERSDVDEEPSSEEEVVPEHPRSSPIPPPPKRVRRVLEEVTNEERPAVRPAKKAPKAPLQSAAQVAQSYSNPYKTSRQLRDEEEEEERWRWDFISKTGIHSIVLGSIMVASYRP